jgi:hypothetical protein
MPITGSIVEDNDQLRGTLARVIGRAEGFRSCGAGRFWREYSYECCGTAHCD